jgi:hypothetical protein
MNGKQDTTAYLAMQFFAIISVVMAILLVIIGVAAVADPTRGLAGSALGIFQLAAGCLSCAIVGFAIIEILDRLRRLEERLCPEAAEEPAAEGPEPTPAEMPAAGEAGDAAERMRGIAGRLREALGGDYDLLEWRMEGETLALSGPDDVVERARTALG